MQMFNLYTNQDHTVAFINSISDIASITGYTNRICYSAKALVKKFNDVKTPTCSASRY